MYDSRPGLAGWVQSSRATHAHFILAGSLNLLPVQYCIGGNPSHVELHLVAFDAFFNFSSFVNHYCWKQKFKLFPHKICPAFSSFILAFIFGALSHRQNFKYYVHPSYLSAVEYVKFNSMHFLSNLHPSHWSCLYIAQWRSV